ncbi:MAG: nucleotide exchange factor GrpE [Chloroflexota bacterium]
MEKFPFDEEIIAVPPAAAEADPAATLRDLFYRCGGLERALQQERADAVAAWRATLLDLLAIYDALTQSAERWGVTTNAQQATMVRDVVAMGRQLLALFKRHQVEAINTVGQPFDPNTSDVVGRELREKTAPNTVLREAQVGFRWPHGVLRRAKVIVSATAAQERDAERPAP